ncbi:TPA: DUF3800 domain-containing protein [Burkholderia vietnamiensis]|nr:DUF3800 domain-containing protein [Burkholderia vietnamiensis]HEP6274482.1 DUF3800 domain-containing protein [Burkholderia vietnamiensis]HEP6283981.1 DUF3800 domain-containing protein [Burkholderia vietnamiensis]HEP6309447.1 DUF3800 domain-containing protein [Burkholderia vietnamiensis]
MDFDVNLMREMMIRAFQLRRADDRLTFYYDETNNIRKLYLTDDGTNVSEHKNFVLGGIVLEGGRALPDLASLRAELRMNSNAPEIKFAHVAKGDFETVLTSTKLRTVLSWIIEHGIMIHYSSVNIIYWAIVDIIDAILSEDGFDSYRQHQQPLKNELYRIANLDKTSFLTLLKRHGYPDIQPGKTADFIADLDAFLDARSPEDDRLPALMLKSLIRKSASLPELTCLLDNEEDMLIDGFHGFYTRPVVLFKNAVHIFDREIQVEKKLSETTFKDGDRDVSFRFADSKSEPGIQIADVVIGFLGKYQCFVEDHPLPELMRRKGEWNKTQTENFGLLRKLIDISDEASNAFIFRSTAMDSEWKNDTFMHDVPPMRHLL